MTYQEVKELKKDDFIIFHEGTQTVYRLVFKDINGFGFSVLPKDEKFISISQTLWISNGKMTFYKKWHVV